MARNVEIKARLCPESLVACRQRAAAIADQGPLELVQRDTFFQSAVGRLKLREIEGDSSEVIFYHRPDQLGPKLSDYRRLRCSNPQEWIDVLSQSNGCLGIVEKRRTVYFAGQTRIHLDEVTGLGEFLELEVVLEDHQSTADGQQIAEQLLEQLQIQPDRLVDVAYLDLLKEDANR